LKHFAIVVDNQDTTNLLIKYAEQQKMKWNVFLTVDTGYGREGVDPKDHKSIQLAKILHESPFINLSGIYSHGGYSYQASNVEGAQKAAEQDRKIITEFASVLKQNGVQVNTVAVGSTPGCSHQASFEGITEIHPGNYIFYDWFQCSIGSCNMDEVACSVITSVISHHPSRNRVMIDAGALALSKDLGHSDGKDWGYIRDHPNLKIVSITQEVGLVETRDGSPFPFHQFPLGSKLLVIPHHSCLTAALHPKFHVVDKDHNVIAQWETCPRGW